MRFHGRLLLLSWAFCLAHAAAAQDTQPHGAMLRFPDISATHIVFLYANDLWVVPKEGGVASPLASPPGAESFPKFSPDGTMVAFGGNYDGVRDLYTLPVTGGIPYRVTYHPTSERLFDWLPSGKLLYSASDVFGWERMSELLTVPPEGGLPERLPVPYGTNATISDDGIWLAYTTHSTDSATWKRYRGGMATDIWLFNLQDHTSKLITDWEGTDSLPMWHGGVVYYLSDGGPEHRLNIWAYELSAGRRSQVTKFSDYDVKWPSMGPGSNGQGEIVFQHGSSLYVLDLATRRSKTVTVTIPGARPTLRPRTIDAQQYIDSLSVSPTAKRVVVEARGDVWTLPAENGLPRNLTRTSGVFERSPTWSPDGKWIAYFSDESGEYEMYVTQSDGKGETKRLTSGRKTFYSQIEWSPDSKQIAFTDKTGTIFLYTLETGEEKAVDRDPWANQPTLSWSADSRWIAYEKTFDTSPTTAIWLYDRETGEKRQITAGMFSESEPAFDRNGDYLFYKSHRAFSPTYDDLGTSFVYTGTQALTAVPLRADVKYPWLPKSDEETWKDKEGDKGENGGENGKEEKPPAAPPQDKPADPVSGAWNGTFTGSSDIPPEGLPFTMSLTLNADNSVTGSITVMETTATITSGTFDPATGDITLVAEAEGEQGTLNGKIIGNKMAGTVTVMDQTFQFTAERTGSPSAPQEGAPKDEKPDKDKPKEVKIDLEGLEARAFALPIPSGAFGRLAVNDKNQLIYVRRPSGRSDEAGIKLFDLKDDKREEKTVTAGAFAFDITPDGKKLLVIRGSAGSIQDAAPGASGKPIVTSGMNVTIAPRVEWNQILHDVWRIMRDFFYDPGMHGVDWPGVLKQYEAMMPDVANRDDLNYVIGEMIGELNVGHAYNGGGDVEGQPGMSVGMLGADFALENGAYRFSRIYVGAPWDADARGPLSRPGVDVKEGDYLLEVNGVALETSRDPWAVFQGLAGRTVTLTVSDKPTKDDSARTVLVEPIGNDGGLRYRAWIEHNRKYVEEQTDGKVGYIYVPDTGVRGQNDLVRQMVGQIGKEALIIDERWNGGGQIPTRFIEFLNRPVTNYWARRDGKDWTWPPDGHHGPKCMLINGLAGSGGDAFPSYFRQAGLGKLIGMRTWGGLVGLSGNPSLIDGGHTSVPTFGFYEKDGTWGIEGHGVDPDIEVVDDPAKMMNGGDPQLDAAIQQMLTELRRYPYKPPTKPEYPNRSGMGIKEADK